MATTKHIKISRETTDLILSIAEQQPDYLTQFEVDLINDRLEAIKEWGDRAVITEKQLAKIEGIHRKVRAHNAKLLKAKEKDAKPNPAARS